MPEAEEVQEIGRKGVAIIKRWLEATTHIELPWDVYHHAGLCSVRHDAGVKKFDLGGYFLTGKKSQLRVECKRYTSAGGQFKEFQHFLGIAYSSIQKERVELGSDTGIEFFWVTFHPFNLDNWSILETHGQVERALALHPQYLGGRDVDEDLLREVAQRATVLVFNPKQENYSLTKDELKLVRTVLDRKVDEL